MAKKKIEIIYDVDGKPIDVVIDKSLSLIQAQRELRKELNKTSEGTKEFELLSAKMGDVEDAMKSTQAKSKDLFGSLSMLPGPVGQFAGSVDSAISSLKLFTSFSFKDLKFQLGETLNDFKGIASNIGKATGITKIYTVLNNALAASFVKVGVGEAAAATGARAFAAALTATGIGALVVGLGLAVSALMEFASGSKEAEKAQKELADQLERTNTLLNMDLADASRRQKLRIAEMKRDGKSEKEIRTQGVKDLKENLQITEKALQDYYDAENKAMKEGTGNLKDIYAQQAALEEKRDQLINDIRVAEVENTIATNKEIEAANNKKLQKNEQHQEKLKQNTKSALDTLLSLQQENAVAAETTERKKAEKELENQKTNEEAKIKQLELTDTIIDGKKVTAEELRGKILAQIDAKYKAKAVEVNKKFDEQDTKKEEEDLKAEEDFNRKVAEIKIAAIKNDTERLTTERQNRYQNDLKDLEKDKEFVKKSEKEKAKIKKDLLTAANSDIAKIKLEQRLKEEAIEKGDYDAKFQRMIAGNRNDLDIQRQLLDEKKKNDDKYYAEQLANEGLTAEQIRDLNDRKLADQIFYTEKSNEIERGRVAEKQKALDDIISIFGEETAVGKAALVAKQILAARELILEVRKTITFSTQAAARSQVAVAEGTAQTAKVGFPQNIPLLIAYAAQAVGIISAIMSAVKSAKSAGAEGVGGGGGQNLGRNYAEGGLIGGKRHAEGGTIIEAEQGEAIMTRGAVTMFKPMLSMMNQMGGGTSFNSNVVTRPDAPSLDNPAMMRDAPIIKTYVVESELTSEQQKQARLKDLSTL